MRLKMVHALFYGRKKKPVEDHTTLVRTFESRNIRIVVEICAQQDLAVGSNRRSLSHISNYVLLYLQSSKNTAVKLELPPWFPITHTLQQNYSWISYKPCKPRLYYRMRACVLLNLYSSSSGSRSRGRSVSSCARPFTISRTSPSSVPFWRWQRWAWRGKTLLLLYLVEHSIQIIKVQTQQSAQRNMYKNTV